jgi:hypothetical protein
VRHLAEPAHEAPRADPDPFEFAKLLEGRIALEFPASVFKEEKVTENYDRSTARYVVVWYNTTDSGEKTDLASRVKALATEVVDADAKAWFSVDVTEATRSRDTSQIMVTYTKKSQPAITTKAAVEDAEALDSKIELKLGDASYRIVSPNMGTTWSVLDSNGTEVESDLDAVPTALGRALKHLLVDLSYLEEVSGGKTTQKAMDDLDRNFLAGVAGWFANSPVVNKEAKKHLVALVELVTKHDFRADKVEEDE